MLISLLLKMLLTEQVTLLKVLLRLAQVVLRVLVAVSLLALVHLGLVLVLDVLVAALLKRSLANPKWLAQSVPT
jgi:hypothetical protein